jgi:HAD superfamily hydrolase (TIGR01509 family)
MENNLSSKGYIKIIAFDFDGVITNLNIDWKSTIHLASKIVGYDIKSLLAFYETCHDTSLFKKVSKEIEKLELEALKNAKPTPFITEFLEKLSKTDAELYVVSMQSTLVVEKFLQQFKLTHYFKGVLSRERFPSKKAQVNHLLSEARVKPNQILLIDDLKKNIIECEELGVKCFHFVRHQDLEATREMWKSISKLL